MLRMRCAKRLTPRAEASSVQVVQGYHGAGEPPTLLQRDLRCPLRLTCPWSELRRCRCDGEEIGTAFAGAIVLAFRCGRGRGLVRRASAS